MAELEAQANNVWQPAGGSGAIAVSDFDRVVIPPNQPIHHPLTEDRKEASVSNIGGLSSLPAVSWSQLRTDHGANLTLARWMQKPPQPLGGYPQTHPAGPSGGHSHGHHHRGGHRGRGNAAGGRKREHTRGQSGDRHFDWNDKKPRTRFDNGRMD